jgi:hypothetical protein
VNRFAPIATMGIFSYLFSAFRKTGSAEPASNPADAGRELRQLMLTATPAKLGQKPTPDFPRVYGVLMDWPIDDQIATIFSSAAGAASLYTTSTFNVIGGEKHESVRSAAVEFVRASDRLFDVSTPTTAFPYPAADAVRFYLLAFSGVRVFETARSSLEDGTNEHADLFRLGQAVLSQLRMVVERRK